MIYLLILFFFQAMGDNESDLHRLGEDIVDHITFIHQTYKKLESAERQLKIQFWKALDTFVKYACFDMKFIFPLMSLHPQHS